jgi:hypothetical protein
MMECLCVSLRKRLSGKSPGGQTLYWLRHSYSRSFDDAIADSVWMLHYPSVLAATPDTFCKVVPAIVRSRKFFETMLVLSPETPATLDPIPGRLNFLFKKNFEPNSEKGKTFQWLLRTHGDEAVDEMIHAAEVFYFPATLASSSETAAQASVQAQRSRLVFEQKMMQALLQSCPDEKALIASRLNKTFVESSAEVPMKEVPTAAPAEKVESAETCSTDGVDELENEDYDDDYVPPEPDPDFN